ncbi:hypothetical protein [Ekhidna sp.]
MEISVLIEEFKNKYKVRMIIYLLTVTIFSGCNNRTTTAEKTEEPIELDSTLMLPDFTISTVEDSTIFSSSSISKEGIILLKYFSPDCNHCQDEAEIYVSKKDSLMNIRTIWISGNWAPLDSIRKFVETYQLAQVSPIVIGKEANNYLLSNYKIRRIPYNLVFIDNQLIKEYSKLDFNELIAINNGDFVLDSVTMVE